MANSGKAYLPFFFAPAFVDALFVVFFETGFLAAAMVILLSLGKGFEPARRITKSRRKCAHENRLVGKNPRTAARQANSSCTGWKRMYFVPDAGST